MFENVPNIKYVLITPSSRILSLLKVSNSTNWILGYFETKEKCLKAVLLEGVLHSEDFPL